MTTLGICLIYVQCTIRFKQNQYMKAYRLHYTLHVKFTTTDINAIKLKLAHRNFNNFPSCILSARFPKLYLVFKEILESVSRRNGTMHASNLQ